MSMRILVGNSIVNLERADLIQRTSATQITLTYGSEITYLGFTSEKEANQVWTLIGRMLDPHDSLVPGRVGG